MKTYKIENRKSGHVLGAYEGETWRHAWSALLEDAGEPDQEPGCDIDITLIEDFGACAECDNSGPVLEDDGWYCPDHPAAIVHYYKAD
jgi:hypothetical protein